MGNRYSNSDPIFDMSTCEFGVSNKGSGERRRRSGNRPFGGHMTAYPNGPPVHDEGLRQL